MAVSNPVDVTVLEDVHTDQDVWMSTTLSTDHTLTRELGLVTAQATHLLGCQSIPTGCTLAEYTRLIDTQRQYVRDLRVALAKLRAKAKQVRRPQPVCHRRNHFELLFRCLYCDEYHRWSTQPSS